MFQGNERNLIDQLLRISMERIALGSIKLT